MSSASGRVWWRVLLLRCCLAWRPGLGITGWRGTAASTPECRVEVEFEGPVGSTEGEPRGCQELSGASMGQGLAELPWEGGRHSSQGSCSHSAPASRHLPPLPWSDHCHPVPPSTQGASLPWTRWARTSAPWLCWESLRGALPKSKLVTF